MANVNKYMVIHNNPGIDCNEVQANWREMAAVKAATWVNSYYNEEKGLRYAIWLAPKDDDLKNILSDIGTKWESVIPVVETSPDMWGEKWEEHLARDATADNLGD